MLSMHMYVYRLSHLIYLQPKKIIIAISPSFSSFFFDCPRLPLHHLTTVSLPCSSLSSPTFSPLFHILLSLRRICAGTRVARPEKKICMLKIVIIHVIFSPNQCGSWPGANLRWNTGVELRKELKIKTSIAAVVIVSPGFSAYRITQIPELIKRM